MDNAFAMEILYPLCGFMKLNDHYANVPITESVRKAYQSIDVNPSFEIVLHIFHYISIFHPQGYQAWVS